jgi:hypothetical protein
VNNVAEENPEMALPWVKALTDENLRNGAIENIARSWLQIDPAKATAWLNQTSLPEDRKTELLKPQQ